MIGPHDGPGTKLISVHKVGGGGKMSKSRGSMISLDEVTYRVREVDPGYEFRYLGLRTEIDYENMQVWQDKGGDGFFYTPVRFGRVPVYLHEKGNPVPARLDCGDGVARVQHPGKFPEVKYKVLFERLQALTGAGEGDGDEARAVRDDLEEAKTHIPPEYVGLVETTNFPFITTGYVSGGRAVFPVNLDPEAVVRCDPSDDD